MARVPFVRDDPEDAYAKRRSMDTQIGFLPSVGRVNEAFAGRGKRSRDLRHGGRSAYPQNVGGARQTRRIVAGPVLVAKAATFDRCFADLLQVPTSPAPGWASWPAPTSATLTRTTAPAREWEDGAALVSH
jgi:hypothetical protein